MMRLAGRSRGARLAHGGGVLMAALALAITGCAPGTVAATGDASTSASSVYAVRPSPSSLSPSPTPGSGSGARSVDAASAAPPTTSFAGSSPQLTLTAAPVRPGGTTSTSFYRPGSTTTTAPSSRPGSTDTDPIGQAAWLARCGDTLPHRVSAAMSVQVNRTDAAVSIYSVTVAVTDHRLWNKSLSVLDQIEIVRDGRIVGVVTNVSPILKIDTFHDAASRPIDQLTVPKRPLRCGEGNSSFGPPLGPGRYQLYVEAIASIVSESLSQETVAGVLSAPIEFVIS